MKISDEQIKKAVLRSEADRSPGSCPGEERLAAFIEDKLGEGDREKFATHLARCPECLESVIVMRALLAEAEKERAFRVPLKAIERARKLDPAHRTIMDLAVSFASGAAKVLSVSDGVKGGLAPATESLRGESRVVSETLVTFTREFPPYLAEVEIERARPDRGEITVRLADLDTRVAPRGVRVSLFENGGELESSMLEDGECVFENLKFGHYRVEITRVGEPIGGIALEMKGDGK